MRNSLRDIVRLVLREDTEAQGFGLKVYGYDDSPPGATGSDSEDQGGGGSGSAIAQPFHLSRSGLERLMKHEGNVLHVYDDRVMGSKPKAYKDVKGFPTIGMGILIDTDEERKRFEPYLNGVDAPASLIDNENKKKIAQFEGTLNKKLGPKARLTQSMYDALFSLYWNAPRFADPAINAIKKGDYAGAQSAIASGPTTSKGEVVQGLVARRKEEADLFGEEGLAVSSGESAPASGEAPKELHFEPQSGDSDVLKEFVAAFAPEYQREFGKPLYVGSTIRDAVGQAQAMAWPLKTGVDEFNRLYRGSLGNDLDRVREMIANRQWDQAAPIIQKSPLARTSHMTGNAFDVPFGKNALGGGDHNKFKALVARVASEKGFDASANDEKSSHFHVDVRSKKPAAVAEGARPRLSLRAALLG
jgi:hypothetical protein